MLFLCVMDLFVTHLSALADVQMNIHSQCVSHHPLGPGVSVYSHLLLHGPMLSSLPPRSDPLEVAPEWPPGPSVAGNEYRLDSSTLCTSGAFLRPGQGVSRGAGKQLPWAWVGALYLRSWILSLKMGQRRSCLRHCPAPTPALLKLQMSHPAQAPPGGPGWAGVSGGCCRPREEQGCPHSEDRGGERNAVCT